MIKPIKPDELPGAKRVELPDFIFQAVNDLIIEFWDGTRAEFSQKRLVHEILQSSNIKRHHIFSRNYLDIEYFYEKEGWSVLYRSQVNDAYIDPFYIFLPK